MKEVIGGTGDGIETHRLHAQVDAEIDRVGAGEEPSGIEEPEIAEYKTRLYSLHEAVVEMELYEQRLDET